MDKDIAIIIPVYNAVAYINNLMRSIDSQTYRQRCEIIMVCDEDINQYKFLINEFPALSIQLLRTLQPQSGPAIARNIGLDYCREHNIPYIMFADADDIFWSNLAVELLYSTIAQGYDFVSSYFYEKIDNNYVLHDDIDIWLFGKIYCTKIIKEHDIIFPNESYNEDVCFNFWYWQCTEKKTFIPEITYLWIDNPDSITRINNHLYAITSYAPLCYNLIFITKRILQDETLQKEKIEIGFANRLIRMYIGYNALYKINDDRVNMISIDNALKDWYNNGLKIVLTNITEQQFKFAWSEIAKQNFFESFIPRIGFYDFIQKIKEDA